LEKENSRKYLARLNQFLKQPEAADLMCFGGLLLAGFAPFAAMLDDPIGQGLFEPDVAAGFFGLDPFVAEDFLALSLKFAVKRRILKKIRVRCHSEWFVTGL
jgi:hypothetical protein